jgi:hypothetical protein
MSQRGFVYHVSKNGADGDWYWEVTFDGWIIGRGLATTEAKSRAAALAAAVSTSRITPFKLTRNLAPTPPPSRCAVTEEAHRRQDEQLAGRLHARSRRPSRDRGGARAEISRGRGREGVRPERRSVQAPVDLGARLTTGRKPQPTVG